YNGPRSRAAKRQQWNLFRLLGAGGVDLATAQADLETQLGADDAGAHRYLPGMPGPERRASERFAYRPESRPLLLVGELAYEIIALGERGLRVHCGEPERWLLGSEI